MLEKIKTLSHHPGSLKFSSKFQLIKVGKLKQQKVFHVITTKVSLVVFTRNSFNNWKKKLFESFLDKLFLCFLTISMRGGVPHNRASFNKKQN